MKDEGERKAEEHEGRKEIADCRSQIVVTSGGMQVFTLCATSASHRRDDAFCEIRGRVIFGMNNVRC
jgi:hypothetical protein